MPKYLSLKAKAYSQFMIACSVENAEWKIEADEMEDRRESPLFGREIDMYQKEYRKIDRVLVLLDQVNAEIEAFNRTVREKKESHNVTRQTNNFTINRKQRSQS